MNIGIIIKYFKVSKYGFIKTYNEILFFHFNDIKSPVFKNDVVTFNTKDTEKGKQAIQIENLQTNKILKEEILNSDKYKWLVINYDREIYQEKFSEYLLDNKITDFLVNQEEYITNYINQFTTEHFLNSFTITIEKKFSSIGGKDWTRGCWNYSIVSKYNINHKFENNFDYHKLNFEFNRNVISEIQDNYIIDFLKYDNFLKRIDFNSDEKFDENEFNASSENLSKIRKSILEKFHNNYSKIKHRETLEHYLHKINSSNFFKDTFRDLVMQNVNSFLENNIKDLKILRTSKREIDEDLIAES